jgi:hypothetical protein
VTIVKVISVETEKRFDFFCNRCKLITIDILRYMNMTNKFPEALWLNQLDADVEFQFSLESESGKECKNGKVLYGVKASDGIVYSMFLTNKPSHHKIHDVLSTAGIGSIFGIRRTEVPDPNSKDMNIKFINEYSTRIINKVDKKYPNTNPASFGQLIEAQPVQNTPQQTPAPSVPPVPPSVPKHVEAPKAPQESQPKQISPVKIDQSIMIAAAMLNAGRGREGVKDLYNTIIDIKKLLQ